MRELKLEWEVRIKNIQQNEWFAGRYSYKSEAGFHIRVTREGYYRLHRSWQDNGTDVNVIGYFKSEQVAKEAAEFIFKTE